MVPGGPAPASGPWKGPLAASPLRYHAPGRSPGTGTISPRLPAGPPGRPNGTTPLPRHSRPSARLPTPPLPPEARGTDRGPSRRPSPAPPGVRATSAAYDDPTATTDVDTAAAGVTLSGSPTPARTHRSPPPAQPSPGSLRPQGSSRRTLFATQYRPLVGSAAHSSSSFSLRTVATTTASPPPPASGTEVSRRRVVPEY